MRRANRTDTNHKEIVAKFRSLGFFVHDISALKNCCDLIVFNGERYELFELKNPEYCKGVKNMCQEQREKFLSEGEARFAEDYRVWIVISAKEIQTIFNGYKL